MTGRLLTLAAIAGVAGVGYLVGTGVRSLEFIADWMCDWVGAWSVGGDRCIVVDNLIEDRRT